MWNCLVKEGFLPGSQHAPPSSSSSCFTAVTTEQGRVVAGGRDPYGTDDPVELGYQRRNRERGRLPGENRLRVRYRDLATHWFEWLTVSKDELEAIAASSGWNLTTFLDSDYPLYVAILQKQLKRVT